ncbi:MAG TPA: hypothetical protein VHZ32_19535, partial [Rhizomicrobium sp.]|nr:hypothetical protein [Rhizomicrobium sp.]
MRSSSFPFPYIAPPFAPKASNAVPYLAHIATARALCFTFSLHEILLGLTHCRRRSPLLFLPGSAAGQIKRPREELMKLAHLTIGVLVSMGMVGAAAAQTPAP